MGKGSINFTTELLRTTGGQFGEISYRLTRSFVSEKINLVESEELEPRGCRACGEISESGGEK